MRYWGRYVYQEVRSSPCFTSSLYLGAIPDYVSEWDGPIVIGTSNQKYYTIVLA